MADFAIGDIQGCYDSLRRLLDLIQFNEREDRLWLVGDLVNRGPQSLEVLRFVKQLPKPAHISLGNHDMHLLGVIYTDNHWQGHDDTLENILKADDLEELGFWLRHQSFLVHDEALNVVMTHAGIAPIWSLQKAKSLANELEAVLKSDEFSGFLQNMYGNEPVLWTDRLSGFDRYRSITNYFTRMRFCHRDGALNLQYKGNIAEAPKTLYPWYEVPFRKEIKEDIIFGHWAALEGNCSEPGIFAIDTGCIWGGKLTAMRIQDKKRFSVVCNEKVRFS